MKNSPEVVAYLTEQVSRSCRQRSIKVKHVFFGGEDVNSYAENFVNTLRTEGWQSGGPEGSTYTGKVAKRCNCILKDYVTRSAFHMGLHGPEDLTADYKRRDTAGQHADFGMGRRYLRMAMRLMRTSQIYLPERLRNKKVKSGERASYYSMIWPSLVEKWQRHGALQVAFERDRPLGQWRNMVQDLYGIELTL